MEALRRAQDGLVIDGSLYRAADAVGAALRRLAELLGHPDHFAAPFTTAPIGHPVAIIPTRPQTGLPSMPDHATFDVIEEDEGDIFAVIWAGTGRVAEWNGVAQRGLTIEQADDAADCMEALDRIAASRRAGRLNG